MKEYYFAGYRLLADDDKESFGAGWFEPFTGPMPYSHSFSLHVAPEVELSRVYSEVSAWPVVCEAGGFFIQKKASQWAFVMPALKSGKEMIVVTSPNYDELALYFPRESYYSALDKKMLLQPLPMSPLLRCAFEAGVTLRDGLSLHASLVDMNGEGVLFLGRSGIGKSTQAKLWKEYLHADFISGDRPCLHWLNGTWFACGMPWDGKDGLCRQHNVPVKAFVSLEQAPTNSIISLTRQKAMSVLLHQAMIPVWDDVATDCAIKLISRVAEEVPFYHLACRPDAEAVSLTYNALFA